MMSFISDPNRARVTVATEVVELRFRQCMAPIDAIEDLEGVARFEFTTALLDPAHERGRFARIAQPHQGVEGEGSVANPSVAIVPIPRAAKLLGKTKSRGRHECAMRV